MQPLLSNGGAQRTFDQFQVGKGALTTAVAYTKFHRCIYIFVVLIIYYLKWLAHRHYTHMYRLLATILYIRGLTAHTRGENTPCQVFDDKLHLQLYLQIPSCINIIEVRLPHLGMFVPGPLWQSAATCRVPLRPSYRCRTHAVHLRSVACLQISSGH